jgi:hypothetical protein
VAPWGVAFQSGPVTPGASAVRHGSVAQTVSGLDAKAGRWFRFMFRGLPQDQFAVEGDNLLMQAEFFANGGLVSFDGKAKPLYRLVQQDRKDLAVNGDGRTGGAAVWRTYALDFMLPSPLVDQVRLSVAFDHGVAKAATQAEFFVTDFSLVRIEGPAPTAAGSPHATGERPANLLPLGGRWFYEAAPGETAAPKVFDYSNADRLIYHDDKWSAPFAGNMSTWLRAGDKGLDGQVVTQDQFVADNVTVSCDATSLIIHTKSLPNHPTGKFPEGNGGNPNYIQEQLATYYLPLNPVENPGHVATSVDNSNRALHMGPIGIAANGVVFFNPFDADSQDASNIMDFCCGHPNPDGLYHYHKYPICINSPWADEGDAHSPLLGWAFDGFPIYGPYVKAGVLAKDATGADGLNAFNIHHDPERGWHYQVTPGRFPYVIGGFWGVEDPRNAPGGRGGRRGPPGGRGPPPGGGFGPPPDGGFGPPPPPY